MPRFLLLKLDGVMQGWGGHTYEDWRPAELFPTRSGLLGMLAACLGIDRQDSVGLNRLAQSVTFAVRADHRLGRNGERLPSVRACDYHTILDARKVDGKPNEYPVQSQRWYLYDAPFTVAVQQAADAPVPLDRVAAALVAPVYTPFLGRRSCPLGRPLLDPGQSSILEADSFQSALAKSLPGGDVVYAERHEMASEHKLRVRDVPMYGRTRRFATRDVHIVVGKGVGGVS